MLKTVLCDTVPHIVSKIFCILLLLLNFSCAKPCDSLADFICECEDTESQRQECKSRVEREKGILEATEQEEEFCDQALDTCTCEELEKNNLAACGFVRE